MRIQLFRPVISDEAVEAVSEVLRSGWIGLGPKTRAFEEAFADYLGAPFCIGLNSGTSSLHLGLRLLDLQPGSEVITTALTFVSTNHVILYERLTPIFADIQPDTGNLDVNSVKERITEKTGAIIIVHYGGYPCDLAEFYALSRDRGIPVIEDCAHACGSTYKEKRIGSHGAIHSFSFGAVKNLTTGDGGALTVCSQEHYARLRKLRCLGIGRDTFQRFGRKGYNWQYDVSELGFRYHMNDIQAAMGLAELGHLDANNARRAEIAALYRERLAGVPGVRLPKRQRDRKGSCHLFWILAEKRDALVEKLRDSGVDAGVHYQRNDMYPLYEHSDLPNTERFWRSVISLPVHLALSDDQVDYVAQTIRNGW